MNGKDKEKKEKKKTGGIWNLFKKEQDPEMDIGQVIEENKDVPFVQRMINPDASGGRDNEDGTASSHLMRAEVDDKGNWLVFPMLKKSNGKWEEFKDPDKAMGDAVKNNNYISFGKEKNKALSFAEGAWKDYKPQEPQKYAQDRTMDPKDYFNYYRDKVLSDDRFLKLDDKGKKDALGRFFDVYGKEYLGEIGADKKFDEFKDRWTVDTYNRIKGIAPKKKEEGIPEERESLVLPDYIRDFDFQYDSEIAPSDKTYIEPVRDLEKLEQYSARQEELKGMFPDLVTKVLENEEFQYVKDNPAYFIERGEESVKELDKWLKKNTELHYSERQSFVNYFTQHASKKQLGNLRDQFALEHPNQNLDDTVEEAAIPFTEDQEPGTFMDPDTDERLKEPKTDSDAEYLAGLDKSIRNTLTEIIKADISNPLTEQKDKMEEEYANLEEEVKKIEQIRKDSEEWAKGAEEMYPEEYKLGYFEWQEKYNKAYDEYQKKVEDLDNRVKEYNQKLEDLPKQVPANKNLNKALKDVTQDAYLEWQYWDERFNQASAAVRGEEGSIGKPTLDGLRLINKMRQSTKAKFEAKSRMYYNQEGPTDIDKDAAYKWEIFGNSLLKAMGMGKFGEALSYYDEPTQQSVMMAMSQTGKDIEIEWTPEEKEALEVSFGEKLIEAGGHLLPTMVELMLLGGVTRAIKGVMGLTKAKNGFRIIRNKELGKVTRIWSKDPVPQPLHLRQEAGKAIRIGLKDPVPTGWEVARTFNPTKWQKAYGTIGGMMVDEAVFRIGDFGLGAITGINMAHLALPNLRFKGRYQALNPVLDIFYKSGLGATIGMEVGATGVGLVESALTDRPFDDVISELYPDVNETTKRLGVNLIVNSILFGGVGLMTRGMAKQASAPIGAKFNKFGQANFSAYFSPVMRDKVYRAAKEFKAKGYPEAGKELDTWLDLTKDPLVAEQMKKVRMEQMEKAMTIMPIGHLREMRELHGLAIRILESQGRGKAKAEEVEVEKTSFPEGYTPEVQRRKSGKDKVRVLDSKGKETSSLTLETVEVGGGDYWTVTGQGGKGLATNLFKHAMNNLPEGYKGIVSFAESMINKEQMPRIHEKLIDIYDVEIRDNSDIIFRPRKVPQRETDGSLTLPIRTYNDIKLGSVISEGGRHYEVVKKETTRDGKRPIKFETIDVETGSKRIFEIKLKTIDVETGLKEGRFDFDPIVKYTINHPLEIPQRLESHYETVRVLDRILQRKGRYGADALKAGPEPPSGLPKATGEFYVKPPEPTKVAKKREEIERKQQEMKKDTGIEPVELPEYMKKEYSFGEPEKILEMPAKEFADNFNARQGEIQGTLKEYAKQINELQKEIDTKFKGRLDLDQRKERKARQDDIIRLQTAVDDLNNKFEGDLTEWFEAARTQLEAEIRTIMPDATEEDINNKILPDLWQAMTDPKEGEKELTIKSLINNVINEETTEGQRPVSEVRPEPKEEEPPKEPTKEEEPPEEEVEKTSFPEGYTPEVQRRKSGKDKVRVLDSKGKETSSLTLKTVEVDGDKYWSAQQLATVTGQEGKGLATNVFKHAMNNLPEGYEGIVSSAESMINKEQVPRIHEKLSEIYDVEKRDNGDIIFRPKKVPQRETEPRETEPRLTEGERMRERGERTVLGTTYKRQPEIKKISEGDVSQVSFSKKEKPEVQWAVIEAKDLQPSHLSGQENPKHFLPEAQPRNRANLDALADAAREKAQNLDPDQLMYSPIAYTGAPTVNERGEVIQGNGRAEAVKYYYDTTSRDPKGYIDALDRNLDDFGLHGVDIKEYKEPVLVRKLYVDDEQAIRLGNYGMRDIEDVSEGTSEIKQASNRLTKEQGVSISNILLKGNEADDTLNDLIHKNARELIGKLTELNVFSPGDAEKFRRKGEITPEGISAVDGVIKGLFFKGGNSNLPEIFEELPHVIKKGIEKSMPVLLRIPENVNILPSVRNALMGLYEYAEFMRTSGETGLFKDWVRQTAMFEEPVTDRYTPFELAMIEKLAGVKRQSDVVRIFMKYEDLVKGKSADLFEGETKGIPREKATEEIFGESYKKTVDDEYEEREVPTEREGEKPDQKPEEGEGAEKKAPEPKVRTVDVKDELKQMTDLLGDLDFGEGESLASGGTGDIDPMVKMLNISKKLIDKFIKQDIIPFKQMMAEIIPLIEKRKLDRLLPFLKAGYMSYWATAPFDIRDNMTIQDAKEFGPEDLDELIGEMNKPDNVDEYSDLIGKTFFIPEINSYVEVDRIEQWQNPEDAKIKGYGGMFEDVPDQFENITVGILKNPINVAGAEKKAVIVDQFRQLINKGEAVEEPPYDNPEYRTEMNKVIKIYQSIGDSEKVQELQNLLNREPKKPFYSQKEGWTWKNYVEGKRKAAERAKQLEDLLSGKLMYDPIEPSEPETLDKMLAFVDSMVIRGAPLSPYIKKYLSEDTLNKMVEMGTEFNQILGRLGYTPYEMMDAYYLDKHYMPSAPWAALYPVGAKVRAYEEGREGATLEKVKAAIKFLERTIAEDEQTNKRVRERAFTWYFKNRLWKGQKIDNFRQLVSMAKDWGVNDKTAIREQTEVALVEMSKAIARDNRLSSGQKYSQILSLYNRFPVLSYRTGEVKEKQQYSTPSPLSYLMGAYTNAGEIGTLLDPSAGNGSLLIAARRKSVRANEIDQRRYWNLLEQGYRVYDVDSRHGVAKQLDGLVDALHMNPPFGGPTEDYNGYPLHGEYVPVAYALESLKDTGKAAIVVGGHIGFKENGQMKGKDLVFFNWLNKYFNVEDIIQLSGDMYQQMGASYPVKLILVNGRKPAPEGAAPLYSEKFESIESWTDLENRITSIITKPNEKSILQTKLDAQRGDDTIVDRGEAPTLPDQKPGGPDASVPGETGDVVTPGGPGSGGEPVSPEPGPDPGEGRRRDSRGDYEPPVILKSEGGTVPKGGKFTPRLGEIRTGRDPGDLPVRNIGKPNQRTKRELGLTERTGDEVTPYLPVSDLGGTEFMVPASIAPELEDAITQLAQEVGDIDQYVVDKLGFSSIDDLKATGMFGAQVDGIAQAIYNIENNNSMIMGHQTGVGKGRIAASMIRYAINNGKMPVFITRSADLFTDMYRDLVDIGFPEIKPFIMNRSFPSGGKVKVFHPETGEVTAEFDGKTYNQTIGSPKRPGNLQLPEDYNVVFSTYSQFTTTKEDRDTQKREFLNQLSRDRDVVFIMDESHSASGQSNVGQFFMEWIKMSQGGLFLSATYAKRPDNMPLYSLKTVLSETNMDYEDLIEAIRSQGTALQEIITLQLTEAGQFSRVGFKMDANFNYLILGDDDPSQITYNPELGKEMVEKYDEAVGILRDIIRFQEVYVNPVIDALNEGVKKEGRQVEARKGTTQAGVSNSPYFSRVWNIVDQLLLSMKVKEMLPLIIKSLEQGRKPAVFLKTTQEAMFDNMVTSGELERGQTIPLDFAYVFRRGMETVMKYTVKNQAGIGDKKILSTGDLSEAGRERYYDLMEKIQKLSTGIPISPIDVLRKGISDAGFKPVEVSGRHTQFEMNSEMTEGTYGNTGKMGKIDAIKTFNNNPGTAIIATRSGTTGVSFHSSIKFKDQSERDGFFPDVFLDINEQVQAFGRLYRADQVNKPAYYMLTSQLPAEKRMFMMTARKLKSLDANTSGNQRQSKNMVDFPDFFNKYGDEVVYEYLKENPGLNNLIGDPLKIVQQEPGKEGQVDKQNAAHKVTGKLQVLDSAMQDEFYSDILERYENLMDYLNSTGQNDLMVTSEDLGATIKNAEVTIQGRGGFSSFGDDTILNTAEVNVTRRPFTKAQLQEQLDQVPERHVEELRQEMEAGMQKRLADQIKEVQELYDEKRKAARKKIMEKEKLRPEEKEREYDIKKDQLDEHEKARISGLESVVDLNMATFHKYLNYFYPGRVVEVPFTDDDQLDLVRMNKGVFISFDVNMNKPNPWVPSNLQLKFATADSRKMFKIPASKPNHIDAIIGNSYHIGNQEMQEILGDWDSLKKARTKEIRFIVTGNILQGMNMYKQGRLIQFTKADGTVDKGILMPENWIKPDNNVSRIPISKATSTIKALAPREYLESYNGDVLIKKLDYSSPQLYELRVPAPSQRGKKYWAENGIKNLMVEPFEQRGDRMVAIFREGQLQGLLDILNDQFKTVLEVENQHVQKGGDTTDSFRTMEEYGAGPRKNINRGGLSNPEKTMLSEMSHPKGKRIAPSPISGATPKKLWEIQLDLTKATGHKVEYLRRPSSRTSAGVYKPMSGRLVIKWEGDMDTLAHEIGHGLDDLFGLLGPEAQPVWIDLMGELQDLWGFGSKPPSGHDNPEQYRMMEGMAEFIRALIVNPGETKQKYPFTYNWVKGRVSEDKEIWDALMQFSRDIREYWGGDYFQQIAGHLHLDPNEVSSPWTWRRENEQGQFRITPFDRFNRLWTNMLAPLEVSWRWAMKQKGIDVDDPRKLLPSQNFEIIARLHLGLDVKITNMLEKGVTTFDNERIIDAKTGKPLSFNLLFEQLPRHMFKDMGANRKEAIYYGLAERIVEVPELVQARQIQKDLKVKGNYLPPLDVLYKPRHAHIVEKFSDKINGILDNLEKGELLPEDVFLDPDRYDFYDMIIFGHFHPELTDYQVAVKAVEEFEQLKHTDPDRYNWISEFNRIYRDLGESALRYMKDAQIISQEAYDWIINTGLYYMAMKRLFALDPKQLVEGKDPTNFNVSDGHGMGGKDLEPKIVIHRFEGSTRVIADPIESLIETRFRAIESAELNYVVQSYAKAFSPKYEPRHTYEGPPPKSGQIAFISDYPVPQSVTFFVDGKKKYLGIRIPEIYEAFVDLLPESGGKGSLFVKYASFLPQLLRRAIVASPPFMVRNIIRDIQHMLIVGKGKRFIRLQDFLPRKGLEDIFELYGAGQFGHLVISRKSYYRVMEAAMFDASTDPRKWILNPVTATKHIGDNLFGWMQMSERPVRRLQFKAALREAKEKFGLEDHEAYLYAAFHTRDLMDFMVGGTIAKEVNKVFIFSNAAIRGLDKIARSAKKNPGSTALALFLVSVLPSILNSILMALFADEDQVEEYLHQPHFLRDSFYRIPLGHGWLTIPKPFELGAFGSIFQRMFDKMLLGDEYAFDDQFLNSIAHLLTPYDMAGIMGGYTGIIATVFNKDLFRQKYIVPPGQEKASIASRNTTYASKFGKMLQEKSDLLTKKESHYLVDPRKIDALITGQLAYYGNYFLNMMESILPGASQDQFRFDATDTGLWRAAPVYSSPHVQYVLSQFQEHPWLKEYSIYRDFNSLLQVYFSERTQGDQKEIDRVGHVIRQIADIWRPKLEKANLYKVDEAVKMLKLEKYK